MKNLRNKMIVGILLLGIAQSGIARERMDRNIVKLEKLYTQALYEEVLTKSAKMRHKEKYYKQSEPHLYKALSQVQLSYKEEIMQLRSMRLNQAGKAFALFHKMKPTEAVLQKHAQRLEMLQAAFTEEALILDGTKKQADALFFMELLAVHYRDTLESFRKVVEAAKLEEKMSSDPVFAETYARSEITKFAKEFTGVPYELDGRNPDGFDSPGLVQYVFKKFGVRLPDAPGAMPEVGDYVSMEEADRGDIIFFGFQGEWEYVITHVGIKLSDQGEPLQVLHATNAGVVVEDIKDGTYWSNKVLFAHDVLSTK